MIMNKISILILLIEWIYSTIGFSGSHYKPKQIVPVVATRIGSFHNSVETYAYYSFPFCAPESVKSIPQNLGEVLAGDRKVLTMYEINFGQDVNDVALCEMTYSAKDVSQIINAIENDFYFELEIDRLPAWGYIGMSNTELKMANVLQGDTDVTQYYLFTHLNFYFTYNLETGNIISITLKPGLDKFVRIARDSQDITTQFTYSVQWILSTANAKDRSETYHKSDILDSNVGIHWLSIANSFILVILLAFALGVILIRVLKNDFTRYMHSDEENDSPLSDDSGWKLVHGDVFRFPQNSILFTAILGAGTQLLAMGGCVLIIAALPLFKTSQTGSLYNVAFVLYACTATLGGYVGAKYYKQMGGMNWVWNTFLTSILLPGPLFAVFCIVNTIAIFYDSTAALPFGTIMMVFAVYFGVTIPLTIFGAMLGRRRSDKFHSPCRTTKVPREIPAIPGYRRDWILMGVAGFLQFSSIYIELHYVFASVWGHKVFTLFGLLILACVLLLIVTAIVSVGLVYFLLSNEDHLWWWRSVQFGGSISLFVYAYSVIFYWYRSSMAGVLQTSYYFGYTLIAAYAIFLAMGTVGFFASLSFVRLIYRAVKLD